MAAYQQQFWVCFFISLLRSHGHLSFTCLAAMIPFLTQHAVLSGLLYGALIYAVMYLIVLPNSAYPIKINFALSRVVINLVAHMLLIGLPISLVVRKASQIK